VSPFFFELLNYINFRIYKAMKKYDFCDNIPSRRRCVMGGESMGERLRSRREQLGLTQGELARVVGVPQSRLSEYECGKNQGMTLHTACKFAVALRCSIDYLAGLYEGYDEEPAAAEASPAAPAGARG
jgi:DNA-binding XRE family transcriptional regulator